MGRTWMINGKKGDEQYTAGLVDFFAFVGKNRRASAKIPCPCVRCGNIRVMKLPEVKIHLEKHDFCRDYTRWTFHGESLLGEDECMSDVEIPLEKNDEKEDNSEIPNHDLNNDSESPVFDEKEETDEETVEDCGDSEETDEESDEDSDCDEPNRLLKKLNDSELPLYTGCNKYTKLSAVVKLYNLKGTNGWSDKSFNDLLTLLVDMLPDGNVLPSRTYDAKKMIKGLGLKYEKIHACPNDCMLFWGDATKRGLENCTVCGESRYKNDVGIPDKNNAAIPKRSQKGTSNNIIKGIPAKVMWYFPIIPRFRRLFANKGDAKMLTWHKTRVVSDAKLRHPADGLQWKSFDTKYPEFSNDSRNLRLALSTDGMNPHGNMSTQHSTWPVVLAIYNLPPNVCMKRKYLLLSILISGPKQPGNDIDVYLQPLLADLKLLWNDGVQVFDSYKNEMFNLKAMLLCTINDYPAYGDLSGHTVHGKEACPLCGDDIESEYMKYSRKYVYMGHRRFLPPSHPYRRLRKVFNGRPEVRPSPKVLNGFEVYERVKDIKTEYGKKGSKLSPRGYKKKSQFFNFLPYWSDLPVRHCLDFMHIEKNVCDNIINTLLNVPNKSKDNKAARDDMVELNIRPELAPQVKGGRTFLPAASHTLKKAEKTKFCECLHRVKVPEGYSSNIKNCVSVKDVKLTGLKSHDCHALMQQLLPVAIRSILPKKVRLAITKFCSFFHAICNKVIDPNETDSLQNLIVTSLCELEMHFPPSFFTIMVHLTVHLVREVIYLGPVYIRYQYPFERLMKIYKNYTSNRYRPEGCIAERAIIDEALSYCYAHLSADELLGAPKNRHANWIEGHGLRGRVYRDMPSKLRDTAHIYVLHNEDEIEPYVEQHKCYLRELHPNKREMWITNEHRKYVVEWIKERVLADKNHYPDDVSDRVLRLGLGPNIRATSYTGYAINGFSFYTQDQDKVSQMQNSGVCLESEATYFASSKDKNPIEGKMLYYGVIQEIWVLDYTDFQIPLFRCNWVDINTGVRKDEQGFTLVNLRKIGVRNDPFILATQAKQVFYVTDPVDENWSVVLSVRGRRTPETTDDDVEYEGLNHCIPDSDEASNEDSSSIYTREDHEEGIWVDQEKFSSKKRARET